MIEGLQCIIGPLQTWKFSNVRESIQQSKKNGSTSLVMMNVLEAKIFQYDFLGGHNVCKITVIDRQHREM